MHLTIPSPLSKHLRGISEIALKAYTLADMVSELQAEHPKLYELLFTPEGTLTGFVNFYLNQECVTRQLHLDKALKDSDTLEVVVSVSGG